MTNETDQSKITVRSIVTGTVFSGIFAALTVFFVNQKEIFPSATQIPVMPYVLLFATVLLFNPLCRLIRVIRPFSPAEILIVFMMGMVSAGVSTFGLSAQLVPVMGNLMNEHWNNSQTGWREHIEPFVDESFFVSVPGVQDAAQAYRDATARRQEADNDSGSTAETRDALDREVSAKRTALAALEARAFERVRIYRRGLALGQRAYPGILPIRDTWGSYTERFRRFRFGMSARAHLEKVLAGGDDAALARELRLAVTRLEPVADTDALAQLEGVVHARLDELRAQSVAMDAELKTLHAELRFAPREARPDLEHRIKRLNAERRRLTTSLKRTRARLAASNVQVESAQRIVVAQEGISALAGRIERDHLPSANVAANVRELLALFPSFDASVRRYLVGDVPWGHWAGALLKWGFLVALTYVVLMAFNLLIFRQWAHNEKLIYPLAALPEELAGAGGTTGAGVPPVFKNGLFWTGFALSAGILGWNLLVASGWIPGLKWIDLINKWQPYIETKSLQALLPSARSSIFFTMIGLSFLTPQKISFSLWFFSILYMIQLFVMVQLGYGVNEGSFPADWAYTMNFRFAEGGGALMVFSLVVLYKCRQYIMCFFRPASVAALDPAEQSELRTSSFLFIFGAMGIIVTLWLGMGANLGYCIFVFVVALLITIGLIRAVAEGGILAFQAPCGPFHLIRAFAGMRKLWTAPSLFAPLLIYYSVFFFDLKTFIAPAMATTIKIRDDLKMKRTRFHVAIIAGILIATSVALYTEITMAYVPGRGADNMQGWFNTAFPKSLYDQIASMSQSPPEAAPSERMWALTGAGLMVLLLFFRQRCFWLPHPLGLIMLVNPIMRTYWFSIMLGWIAKTLVTKYGNKETYAKVKGAFIGLIAGELCIVALSLVLSIVLAKTIKIDLNR